MTDFVDAGRRSLAKLVQSTGTSAVMVSFLDSDVGFVEALYEMPLEHFPIEPAVASALAWSAAAGLTPDEEAIRQTLTGSALFAEQLSSALMVALGLPGAT
ncbi:hypothetical protein ABZT27_31325 [Streptomyces sp. NPDC005389]|uniref:hypothetical protein n=1 Tax=Streptomyces sp. NPDC005389 TaxID=3157040 RepID=UPI0033B2D7A2